jgi:two-component system response regulator YesN
LHKQAPLRAAGGVGGRLELAELRRLAARPGWPELAGLVAEACRCYAEKTYLNYVKALQHCARTLREAAPAGEGLPKKALADFIRCSTGCPVMPHQSLKTWIRQLEAHGERTMLEAAREDSRSADVVGQVIAYVDKHYMHDIGIGQIAEQLHITPNYLSSLFHKKTGATFMEYLTRTRMLRAKELLADPNLQIQQVAEQVGYCSARYFTKLFTRFAGCYPSEYRARFKSPGAPRR